VIREGVLFELQSGLMGKKWRERYVVVSELQMSFFKDEESYREGEKPSEKWPAKDLRLKFTDDIQSGRSNCFCVLAESTPKQMWWLSAVSEADKKRWLSVIRGLDPATRRPELIIQAASKASTRDPEFTAIPVRQRKPREEMNEEEKFLDEIDRAREEEESKLNTLGNLMDGLKDMALNMNTGLQNQKGQIDRLDEKLDKNSARLKADDAQIRKLIK